MSANPINPKWFDIEAALIWLEGRPRRRPGKRRGGWFRYYAWAESCTEGEDVYMCEGLRSDFAIRVEVGAPICAS